MYYKIYNTYHRTNVACEKVVKFKAAEVVFTLNGHNSVRSLLFAHALPRESTPAHHMGTLALHDWWALTHRTTGAHHPLVHP